MDFSDLLAIRRNEKSAVDLSLIPKTFYSDVSRLIALQKDENESKKILSTFREIIAIRYNKLSSMVLLSLQDSGEASRPQNMVDEEAKIYTSLLSMMGVLWNPKPAEEDKSEVDQIPEPESVHVSQSIIQSPPTPGLLIPQEKTTKTAKEPDKVFKPETENKGHFKTVRFLRPLPAFIDKELMRHGPFEEGQIVDLPLEIADILIKKEAAEAV